MPVRLATRTDVAAVATLVQRYWEFECISGFDAARVEALLQDLFAEAKRGACWLAEEDGHLVGYLLAVFMFSLEHGGMMAEIDEVFVSQEARSAGHGSLLLAAASRDLGERGFVRLQLQLGIGNERARAFYDRHGFRRRGGYELLDMPLQP